MPARSIVAESAGGQHFQRHIALQLLVAGSIDHTHSTGSDLFHDAVVAECLANHRRKPNLAAFLGCTVRQVNAGTEAKSPLVRVYTLERSRVGDAHHSSLQSALALEKGLQSTDVH